MKLIEKSKLKLHLDATGSVVRKLDRDEKNFLYYALTLQHPIAKISPIPLAEMLTNEQTNVEITHFLNRWYYGVRRILNRDICPSQVEVDFSWALLHSICKIFNRQHQKIILILVGSTYKPLKPKSIGIKVYFIYVQLI